MEIVRVPLRNAVLGVPRAQAFALLKKIRPESRDVPVPVKCPLCAEEQKKRAQKYFDGPRIHLAGIDDAHSYGAVEIEKAASGIHNQFFILLSQTPEVYQAGADAGFQLMLNGYTHGGQICIALNAVVPRCVGAGRGDMSR